VGVHEFQIIQVALEHPLSMKTTPVWIEVVAFNTPPFFEAPLPESVEVTKTAEPSAWSLQLPATLDLDPEDTISVSARLGVASTFVDFDANELSLKILDLSDEVVKEGSFNVTVSVEDGTDSVSHTIVLTVFPFEPPSEELEEQSALASNSTDANVTASTDKAYDGAWAKA